MKQKLFRSSILLPNGKRKWISSTTREGLEKKKKEFQLQISAGVDVLDNTTFGEYAELWLRVYKEPYLRAKSIEALQNTLHTHILPYLNDVPLKKVSPIQIQMILGRMTGLSKSLNDKAIQVLRSIFNTAVDNNLLTKSPVPVRLRSGGIATKEKAALTVEQSKQLLNAVFGTRAYLFCLIALQTGMRRGEILGLMWSDIDFEEGVIRVTHNKSFVMNKTDAPVTELLKTEAARRTLPMGQLLTEHLQRVRAGSVSPYVLSMKNGESLTKSAFRSMWTAVDRRTVGKGRVPRDFGKKYGGMEVTLDFDVHPHLLRHTYITQLFEAGLDIKQVQYLAGHSKPEMTMRVYTHYRQKQRAGETRDKVHAALNYLGEGVTA